MAKMIWPKDAKSKKYADVKQFMTDTGDEKTIGKISKDELKNGLTIDGIELDPVKGGATSATATALAAGPAGQLRKREASPGWYSANGAAAAEAAKGKRWIWGWNGTIWTLWDMGETKGDPGANGKDANLGDWDSTKTYTWVNTGDQYVFHSGSSWKLGTNQTATSADVPGVSSKWTLKSLDTNSLATKASVTGIQGTRSIALGTLVDGRYSSPHAVDTNTAYKLTESFIAVDPAWILNISNEQSANTFSPQFDEFKQLINPLVYTAGVDFALHPKARFIRLSGTTSNMNAKSVTVKEALGETTIQNISKTINTSVVKGVSLNYFNWATDFLYQRMPMPEDGRIVSVSNAYSTTPMYRLKSRSAVVVGNIFVVQNAMRIHWFRADGSQISYQEIPVGSFRRTFSTSRYFVITEVPPADAVYFRIRYEYTSSSTTAMIQRFFISHAEYVIDFESQYEFSSGLTAEYVVSLIRHEMSRTSSLMNAKVALLADSNGAAGNGFASYNTQLRDMNFPSIYEVLAEGGATISSIAKNGTGQQLFGAEYLSLPVSNSTGNTFVRQAEVIIDQVVNNPNYIKPNVVLIIGGTNDFDRGRHVTPAMIQQSGYADYTEYMEATFMTVSPAYKDYKPLADIDRGQVAGALRYIIERLGTYLPNTVFLISTPIQSSTEHNAVYAQRTVRDIEWIAGRLSVPVIRMWHESGMPMLWDNKTDKHRYLGDGVHLAISGVNQPGANVAGRYLSNEVRKKFLPLIEQIVVQ